MRKRKQSDEDIVTVHVTFRGGLYVDSNELLRSKAAQKTMKSMDGIFRDQIQRHREGRDSSDDRGR